MPLTAQAFGEKSRLRALLEHFSVIEDPRGPWKVAHPLPEVLLLVVCGTIADCDDYDHIAAWGEVHLPFLREVLPYHYGVPGGRWLTLLMNRIDPGLFSACFTAWVREIWPDRPDFVAIDGKTSRRSHDRGNGKAPLHLVSAFATTARLVLGQEAVSDKSNEITAIPVLVERLAANGGLKGATVTIDAIACNATIAAAINAADAHYLLAVKSNQPTLRTEIEDYFASAPAEVLDTRYYISSANLTAQAAAEAVRGHWGIENRLHWVLDVVFGDDQARLRTGHGAKNMAVVRHFAINLVRAVADKKTIKLRRKVAGWDVSYLTSILGLPPR